MSNTLIIADMTIGMLGDLYSLSDLHKASGSENRHRPTFFLQNQETQALIAEIESQNSDVGIPTSAVKTIKGGNNKSKQGTYVCKELVYRYAMWISPKFSLMVIRAFDAMTQGEFVPCTKVAPQPTQSSKLTTKQLNDLKYLIRFTTNCFEYQGSATHAIYARIRQLTDVQSLNDLTTEHLFLICNEMRRLYRIVLPYRLARKKAEEHLIKRMFPTTCIDHFALAEISQDIEIASNDYAMQLNNFDQKLFGETLNKLLGGIS